MKYFITVFLYTIIGSLSVMAQGIDFSTQEWDNILDQAKAEDKIVFVDAFTEWCGPCKKMSSQVFTSKKVGKFYNDNFISVKIDMEKGKGPQIGQNYNVFVYPTLLFVDGFGSLVHRVAGYQTVDQLIAEGKQASDPSNSLAAMDAKYNTGERDPGFLKTYLKAKAMAMDGTHLPIAKEYLKTQSDWSEPDNLSLIFNMTEDSDSEMFDYLIKNKTKFVEQYGVNEVEGKIQGIIFSKIGEENADLSMEDVGALFHKAYPSRAAKMTSAYRMTFTRERGDREGFGLAAIDHFKKYPTQDPDELNDAAWTMYQVIDDKKLLKGATKLAKKSIKLDNGYYNTDTLAALYSKMGKKGKAIKTAQKAIALAKENNEDYSTTQELIQKLQAGEI